MKSVRWATPLLFLMATPSFSLPIEILKEGNVTIGFEKSGDESQIKEFKEKALPKVQSILQSLSSELGVSSSASEAKVYFYAAATYAKIFPQAVASSVDAFYNGREVNARFDNELTSLMETTLYHELTHLILDKQFSSRIPMWLNEGLAMYFERKNSFDSAPIFTDYNTIVVGKQKGDYIPIAKLESKSVFHREFGTEPSKMGYRIAYVAVYELIQKSGMDAMRNYISGVAKGKDPRQEFVSAFGIPYEKFDEFLVEVATKKT